MLIKRKLLSSEVVVFYGETFIFYMMENKLK